MDKIILAIVGMTLRIFGRNPHIEDVFDIKYRIKPDGLGGMLGIIRIFIKTYTGFRKEWSEKETIAKIREETEAIIDDNIMLDVKASKANKIQCVGTEKEVEEGQIEYVRSDVEREFNYQFEIVIVKRIGKKNNGTKNKTV